MRIGIDFGTSRSSVAYLKDGAPELVIQPFTGAASIPSTVYAGIDSTLIAGQGAENFYRDDPSRGFRHAKRALWRQAPETFGGSEVAPHDMVAAVLRALRASAEAEIGAAPDDAVITIPAGAPEAFRVGLIAAAHEAGFGHVDLVSVPVAAASYVASRAAPVDGDTILVFVLGGGGFDAGLFRCERGAYRPLLDPIGTEHGGGLDFDHQIYFDVLHRCPAAAPLLALERSDAAALRARLSIMDFCRSLKERLSEVEAAGDLLILPEVAPVQYALTRAHFNELIKPYLLNSIELCRDLIARAGIVPADVRGILLAGGCARIPVARSLVESELGRPLLPLEEPDLIFSQGAALFTPEHGGGGRGVPPIPSPQPDQSGLPAANGQPVIALETAALDAGAAPLAAGRPGAAVETSLLPDLAAQGMARRLARGQIRSLQVGSDDALLVVSAGGADLIDMATGEPRWSIDQPTSAGAIDVDRLRVALAGPLEVVFWDVSSSEHAVAARAQGTHDAGAETVTASRMVRAALDDEDSPAIHEQLREQRSREEARTDGVTCLAFSPDGALVAAGRQHHDLVLGARGLSLWNTVNGTQDHRLQSKALQVSCVAFSPDGQTLAAGTTGAKALLYDVASGRQLHEIKHGLSVTCLVFSPDSTILATSSQDKRVTLWDAKTAAQRLVLEGHTHPATCMAFSPDGRTLATGGRDRTVRLWDAADGREIGKLDGYGETPVALAFPRDGHQLIVAGADDSVTVWEVARLRRARVLQRPETRPTHLAFDGASVPGARETAAAAARQWLFDHDGQSYTLRGGTAAFVDPGSSADGRYQAEGGQQGDKTVHFRGGTASQPRRLEGHGAEVTCVSFNPAATLLVSGGADAQLRLWALPEGMAFGAFAGHAGPVRVVAFSPDGRLVASGADDKQVRIWELASGKCLATLEGHDGSVRLLVFSPDGRHLASAGHDSAALIWELRNGWESRCLQGHSEQLTSLAFSADSRLLATAGAAGVVRVWRV